MKNNNINNNNNERCEIIIMKIWRNEIIMNKMIMKWNNNSNEKWNEIIMM